MENLALPAVVEVTSEAHINRRRMLLGLATASAAAATVSIEAAAAPVENPELIRAVNHRRFVQVNRHTAYELDNHEDEEDFAPQTRHEQRQKGVDPI